MSDYPALLPDMRFVILGSAPRQCANAVPKGGKPVSIFGHFFRLTVEVWLHLARIVVADRNGGTGGAIDLGSMVIQVSGGTKGRPRWQREAGRSDSGEAGNGGKHPRRSG